MNELELNQVTELCVRLGAPRGQAETMAAQLLKRAEQIAAARGVSRENALAHLLRFVAQGRAGEVPKDIGGPISPRDDAGKQL